MSERVTKGTKCAGAAMEEHSRAIVAEFWDRLQRQDKLYPKPVFSWGKKQHDVREMGQSISHLQNRIKHKPSQKQN